MRNDNYIFFYYLSLFFSASALFVSCEKSEAVSESKYNEKANELIGQIVSDNSCNCMLEIPKESIIAMSAIERPNYDIRKPLLEHLNLKSSSELDSLIRLSNNFILDKNLLMRNKVKLVDLEFLKSLKRNFDLKTCSKGVICIQKPIFDKRYKTAIITYTYAFTCSGGFIMTYIYKNGKWVEIETAGNSRHD
ncbi:hypothetical protein [Flavobacterium sp. UBA7663]|uniref:hypothetical protein n=1 Tax=Flavobacterium sp. UBA7663 TaxID=1946557 RepID=UPI0025BD9A4E|nr:hypothetical protein [Flavobacterium sp. UBA7663]